MSLCTKASDRMYVCMYVRPSVRMYVCMRTITIALLKHIRELVGMIHSQRSFDTLTFKVVL